MKNTILATIFALTVLSLPASGEVIQGQLTGPFGNEIDTRTEGTFLLHRSNAGTVTVTATDSDANATLSIQAGGTGGITLGDSDSTVTVSGSGGLTLANGETLNTGTDAVFDFTRNTAGTVTLTASDDNATANLTLLAGGAAALTLGGTTGTDWIGISDSDFQLRNGATGAVTLDFRDYADTTDDDMAHAILRVNCTDTGSAAEDCDFSIEVVEAGAGAEARFSIDADGGITIGSSNNNSITLTADSTGDGELTVPGESIAAAEILNLTRSIPLPIPSWVPCAGTVAGVWDASGTDAEPDLVAVNTALVVEYDATGASVDIDEICTAFTVPADWASGGSFVFRLTQGAATITNLESVECRISVDGAAIGAADEDNLANQVAVQSVTSAPAGTWAAGASIGIACKQGNASADDIANFHSAEGQYTATQ